jgi:hypothetical protein
MGIADEFLKDSASSPDRFLFWLLSTGGCTELGARFWRTVVLRECLPSPEAELSFEAFSGPLG